MDIHRPPDIVVIAGGAAVDASLVASVTATTQVVAADAGVSLALALGWDVDVAIGDFDSICPEVLGQLVDDGVDVRPYPRDKDQTDLELALGVALDQAPARVLVTGLEGGRPDHALANLLVAASERFAGLDVELALGGARAWVVRGQLCGAVPVGTVLSVVPVHGAATVSFRGVRWPLDHQLLAAGSTRGVSNEVADPVIDLVVHDGTALCFNPHPLEELP